MDHQRTQTPSAATTYDDAEQLEKDEHVIFTSGEAEDGMTNHPHQGMELREGVGRQELALESSQSKGPNVNNAASIPDGGKWAWLQVLGAFFLFFNSW
jgi:hypothetical protein